MSIIVKVVRDEDPMSPRDQDNVGLMACWHRQYKLGDVQPDETPEQWLKANAPKGSIVLNVYLYDHSGLRMSVKDFGDPWDSGQVGYIIVTPTRIRKHADVAPKARITKKMRDLVTSCLKQEIEIYDHYLSGNVWGFMIEDDETHEVIDSCFGFFGDDLDGMKHHMDAKYHTALEAAWEARHGVLCPHNYPSHVGNECGDCEVIGIPPVNPS